MTKLISIYSLLSLIIFLHSFKEKSIYYESKTNFVWRQKINIIIYIHVKQNSFEDNCPHIQHGGCAPLHMNVGYVLILVLRLLITYFILKVKSNKL